MKRTTSPASVDQLDDLLNFVLHRQDALIEAITLGVNEALAKVAANTAEALRTVVALTEQRHNSDDLNRVVDTLRRNGQVIINNIPAPTTTAKSVVRDAHGRITEIHETPVIG